MLNLSTLAESEVAGRAYDAYGGIYIVSAMLVCEVLRDTDLTGGT